VETVKTAAAPQTSAVARVPQAAFTLFYGKKNVTADIAPYVTSVVYTDHLDGESDELEVALEDTDGRWLRGWYPGKSDRLALRIGYEGAPLVSCGQFEIDEIEFAMPPSTVTIKALATGVKTPLRTRGGFAYENTTLAAIAAHIAKRNKLTLIGKIRDLRIDRITQYQERDVAFLKRVAREYGYAFKVAGDQLVFTELAELREAKAVLTLSPADLTDLRLSDKVKDVYAKASVKHHDPKQKKLVTYDVDDTGEASGDTLKVTARASDKAVAQTKAQAALDSANGKKTEGSLSLPGNPRLVAGINVTLTGLGAFDGKYLVKNARHSIDRDSGYTTELDVQRGVTAASAGKKKDKAKGTLKVYGRKDGVTQVVGTTPKQ
jgi:phage protein D